MSALRAVIVLFRGATSNQSSDDLRVVELCRNYDPVRKIQRKEMIKNKPEQSNRSDLRKEIEMEKTNQSFLNNLKYFPFPNFSCLRRQNLQHF